MVREEQSESGLSFFHSPFMALANAVAGALPPLLHLYWSLATGAVVSTWCVAVPGRFK